MNTDANPVPARPDPSDRPAVCRYAYAMIGVRLLEWEQEFALTNAEYLSLLSRCIADRLTHVMASERSVGPVARGMGGPMVPPAVG